MIIQQFSDIGRKPELRGALWEVCGYRRKSLWKPVVIDVRACGKLVVIDARAYGKPVVIDARACGRHFTGRKDCWERCRSHDKYFSENEKRTGSLGPRLEARIGGGLAEWFRALDLKSGGPWFKSSTLPLAGFALGSPEFNSSATLCK
ncbi:hypothetical protein OS493_011313 [Desmophyllum pertusum]|uniref:Uncharacterized protein n=1 Tax=Desmophyllum pertusum TaxID=174260 RepID=A0A9W9Z5F9_9CNID|nr:hypothetical protein OS493_011313 [Desmophyllum pertusum]